MKPGILVFNAGSSSLKYAVYGAVDLDVVFKGDVEPIDDIDQVLQDIQGKVRGYKIVAVGHRVVHGGKHYTHHVVIDDDVLMHLRALVPLAPLHQPYNLSVIEWAIKTYGDIPQIACFDTAFHRTQSHLADLFPLPYSYEEEGVIRYGFHGLSYEYIASQITADRTIAAHLGNGASLCAMRQGQSMATSMGFTALDGLMMGTRTGTIDPGVILYLLQNQSIKDVENLLYKQSGLQGVSGISHDMRILLASASPRAKTAIDLFCYLAAKQIGSLIPTINGLDCLVFTAGIGENCPLVRSLICDYFSWMGVVVDESMNIAHAPVISTPESAVEVRVIATDEQLMIAKVVLKLNPSSKFSH